MTSETILIELLERIAANKGATVYIDDQELNKWPADIITAIKSNCILEEAQPARSVICPGCERSCLMPVNTILNQTNMISTFIVCDKRNDINRVSISLNYIEQWQTSGYLLAKFISNLLGLPHTVKNTMSSARWEMGVFRGSKHSSHLVLTIDSKLIILAAGHQLVLDELLTFVNGIIQIDKRKIIRAVDNPATGGGNSESAAERRKRLQKRIRELKLKKIKGFLKKTAEEEGISVQRLKQIIDNKKNQLREKSGW